MGTGDVATGCPLALGDGLLLGGVRGERSVRGGGGGSTIVSCVHRQVYLGLSDNSNQ